MQFIYCSTFVILVHVHNSPSREGQYSTGSTVTQHCALSHCRDSSLHQCMYLEAGRVFEGWNCKRKVPGTLTF